MLLIQTITSAALQTQNIVLQDGSTFSMTMYFSPMQYMWLLQNLTYGTFSVNSIRICNLPNLLFQWQNILPFGLGCFSQADREPSQQADFSSGASQLYVLTAAEVAQYSEFIKGG